MAGFRSMRAIICGWPISTRVAFNPRKRKLKMRKCKKMRGYSLIFLLAGMISVFTFTSRAATNGVIAKRPSGEAVNNSYPTTCAEEDNVNVPIYATLQSFKVKAVHPKYDVGDDNCAPDFTGCQAASPLPQATDICTKLYDDGINVVEVCAVNDWWRPYSFNVLVDNQATIGHYLRWYRKIEGAESWPQFLVLYEDGNMRLKPHPPEERNDVCFGNSVIIGPAAPTTRPYVDIQEVRVDPRKLSLKLTYRNGGAAHLNLSVNRVRAIAKVKVHYDTSKPFATFRSMWVEDGNCDVDHIKIKAGDFPILTGWSRLSSREWFFHRKIRSRHNTSAPDIQIKVLKFK